MSPRKAILLGILIILVSIGVLYLNSHLKFTVRTGLNGSHAMNINGDGGGLDILDICLWGDCLTSTPSSESTSIATQELQSIIENVTSATAYRYHAADNLGNVLDAIKIISNPVGGYLGVYHSGKSGGSVAKLATSTDLINWTFRHDLDANNNTSQPTITALPDGSFVVAFEVDVNVLYGNHLRFQHYQNLNSLLNGSPERIFDVPGTAEYNGGGGTPNFYAIPNKATFDSETFTVGFHYNNLQDGKDEQALGVLTWTGTNAQWSPTKQPQIDAAIRTQGVAGDIGDRDFMAFQGHDFSIYEGRKVNPDWSTWRPFLIADNSNQALPLQIRTHNGSIAFANPSFTDLVAPDGSPAVVVTLFLPSEGNAPGEAGELIYYKANPPAIKSISINGPPTTITDTPTAYQFSAGSNTQDPTLTYNINWGDSFGWEKQSGPNYLESQGIYTITLISHKWSSPGIHTIFFSVSLPNNSSIYKISTLRVEVSSPAPTSAPAPCAGWSCWLDW